MATVEQPAIIPDVLQSSGLHRFSVDDYHQMIETGILTTQHRVEMLQGVIVNMNAMGNPHRAIVARLMELLIPMLPDGWHALCQLPITLSDSEPEPDFAIVRGRSRDYFDRYVRAEDVPIVVEVSDSSVEFDQTHKAAIYADAGISEYWIVNLQDRSIEIYSDPQTEPAAYRRRVVVSGSETVKIVLDGDAIGQFSVEELWP